jgi:chromosome partitioning protein
MPGMRRLRLLHPRRDRLRQQPSKKEIEMSIVLALASNKGGVGKTTTAVTIGSYFAFRRNWRVLIVDVDIQGHVGLFLGLRDATDIYKESGLQKLLLENQPIEKVAVRARENLDIILNSFEAKDMEQKIMQLTRRDLLLREKLAGSKYDLIILDTAPAYSNLHLVALCASDYCIIPTGAAFADLTGVNGVLETLNTLSLRGAPTPAIIGALPTRFERVTVNTKNNYDDLVNILLDRNIQTLPPIPLDTNIKSCVDYGKTIWEYAPMCRGVKGYDTPLEHVKIPNSIGGYGGYLHLVEILEIVMKRGGRKQ